MSLPLVSVIIPTYKREKKIIARSIQSVIDQTYSNLEIIVVDDSPSDFEGRVLIKNYIKSLNDERIKYIEHKNNRGANIARNTGIENSKGEYCAFLDDDDQWHHNKLNLQMKCFLKDNEVALVYCKARTINETNGTEKVVKNVIKNGYHYNELLKKNFIGSNSFVVIKKEILNKVGNYDTDLLSNQDYDLFLRIAKKHKIDGVDKVLVYYFVHSGERITTNPEKQLQGRLSLFNKFYSDIKLNKETLNIWRIKNIPLYYRIGEKRKAIIELLKLFIKHPIFVTKFSINTLGYILQIK